MQSLDSFGSSISSRWKTLQPETKGETLTADELLVDCFRSIRGCDCHKLGGFRGHIISQQSWETCRPRTRGPPPPGVALGWNTAPEQVLNTKTSDPWNIRINSLSNQLHRLSGFITFGTVICFGDKRVLLVTAGRSEHEQQFFGQTEEQKLNRS